MQVDLFDFHLPEGQIALRPAVPRDAARLLVVPPEGAFTDTRVAALPSLLRKGDLLIVNDTRVLPVQFTGHRTRDEALLHAGAAGLVGPRVSVTLHRRVGPNAWLAFVKGSRKIEAGDRLTLSGGIAVRVADKRGGEALLAFELDGAALDDAIRRHGTMPLPPYIAGRRAADERDAADYQTLFADEEGSVAAPTAGLHFTPALVEALGEAGIAVARVTLHVGAGTFLPVKVQDTNDHTMHPERGTIDAATADRIRATQRAGGRLIAVGTTSLRLLEAAAAETGEIAPFSGETSIFITPGYRIRIVDALLTNFHLPRSTLFMLVCAFSGLRRMKDAYAHAIATGYRFYSYGDASLLFRAGAA
ncbi:MAG: tRNA preQ1(34) S-adenosylmethionine ribosyltransferase-isomerase QueA [Alphaproteobacteria bacterium]|nr:tRNA preQ1(34) S-adenosylmethionine ribosyltransferase-isomerase QueA [Alphaproteobacteria bacterium]